MNYSQILEGTFLSRPNRFIAHVEIAGRDEVVHVKNTGRCKELLVPGAKVYLSASDNPERKTRYDLIAVEKKRPDGSSLLVNMDSQIPNDVAEEWLRKRNLFSSSALVRREVFYGDSRFDLYVEDGERKAFMEVKGCTLENDGVCAFPDAPTERGLKHVQELVKAKKEGYEAYILFVIQMEGMKVFTPNYKTHRAFGEALENAQREGVEVLAWECSVTPTSIEMVRPIPVEFES